MPGRHRKPRPTRKRLLILPALTLAAAAAAAIPAAQPAHATTDPAALDARALAWAKTQAGAPYVYGAAGPYSAGYDCSGLASAAYAHVGVAIPHSTFSMLADPHLRAVPVTTAPPGALLFFGTGHTELAVRPGVSFGAQHTGTVVGEHRYGGSWQPTAAYIVVP